MTTTTFTIVHKLDLCIFVKYNEMAPRSITNYALIFTRGGTMAIHAASLFLLAIFTTSYYTLSSIYFEYNIATVIYISPGIL